MGMFHEIMIDFREYRLRQRRLKRSRLYDQFKGDFFQGQARKWDFDHLAGQ